MKQKWNVLGNGATQQELRRTSYCSHVLQIPYSVLDGSKYTSQGSSRGAESQRYRCPADAKALCYGPGPQVREVKEAPGEVRAMADPVEASCPQMSHLIRKNVCELPDGCCFLSAPIYFRNFPVPHPNWKHRWKGIWGSVIQSTHINTILHPEMLMLELRKRILEALRFDYCYCSLIPDAWKQYWISWDNSIVNLLL